MNMRSWIGIHRRGTALIQRLPCWYSVGVWDAATNPGTRLHWINHCQPGPSSRPDLRIDPASQRARELRNLSTCWQTSDESSTAPPSGREYDTPVLSFCGGGVYFWWQLGVVKFLRERYDLSKTNLLGASSGAIAATLTACGVSAEHALQSAMKLAKERKLLDKPLGVVGVWGKEVRDWLHDTLPQEAADMCRERVKLLVTELPFCRQMPIGRFSCRNDLINVNMASAHVPILLDGKVFTRLRGRLVFDGGMQDWLFRSRSKAIAVAGAIMIDHHRDEFLTSKRMDMKKPLSFDTAAGLIQTGYEYGRRRELEGAHKGLAPLLPQLVRNSASQNGSESGEPAIHPQALRVAWRPPQICKRI